MRKKLHAILAVLRTLLLVPVAAFTLDYATTVVVKANTDPSNRCVTDHHSKHCHVHGGAIHE